MILETKNLSCGYSGKALIKNVNLKISSGETVSLLGPNGVGKTTLFKTLLGLLKPVNGSVLIDDENLDSMSAFSRASSIAYVPQATEVFFPYKAEEIVMMGRAPHIGFFGTPSKNDYKHVDEALTTLSIQPLAKRVFTELSSGEKQLVLIARAIAQQSEFLILDEPTSNLDFGNQSYVISEIKKLSAHGIGIIMTTHHPNHVFESEGNVILIDNQRNIRIGESKEIMTKENLRTVYGINVEIATHESEHGSKHCYCVPVGCKRSTI